MATGDVIPNSSSAPLDADHAEHGDHEDHGIGNETRRLQKIKALLIATQFGAEHDAEFDVPDALAGIILLVQQLLANLDQLELAVGGEQ